MRRLAMVPPNASADQARTALEAAGWRQVGTGDWAWALADPSDELAVRITPFDPGYLMFASDCLRGPSNRWLPRISEIAPLQRDGYLLLMARLWPADEAAASAFCAALGIANDTGHPPPKPGPFEGSDHPDIAALRTRIRRLLADGAARYRLWAGSDIRAGDVMADAHGALKLVDPVGIAGWKIVEALRAGRVDLLADFTRVQLEDFLSVPYFRPGREGCEQEAEIRRQIEQLYPQACG